MCATTNPASTRAKDDQANRRSAAAKQPRDEGCLRRDHEDDAAGGIEELRHRVQPADLFNSRPIKTDERAEPQLGL